MPWPAAKRIIKSALSGKRPRPLSLNAERKIERSNEILTEVQEARATVRVGEMTPRNFPCPLRRRTWPRDYSTACPRTGSRPCVDRNRQKKREGGNLSALLAVLVLDRGGQYITYRGGSDPRGPQYSSRAGLTTLMTKSDFVSLSCFFLARGGEGGGYTRGNMQIQGAQWRYSNSFSLFHCY